MEPGICNIHSLPKVYPNTLRSKLRLGLQLSSDGWDYPSPDTQLVFPSTAQNLLPSMEKRAAVSDANSLLFKAPEGNWSKSKLGGTPWSSPGFLLTFHNGDVNSSSPGPGDTAQPWAMGYGGTAAAGNHPCSEVKGKENFVSSLHAQM